MISNFQIIQIMGSIMAISTLWEFRVNSSRMWGAMTVTALRYGFMLVGMALNTIYIMVFCC